MACLHSILLSIAEMRLRFLSSTDSMLSDVCFWASCASLLSAFSGMSFVFISVVFVDVALDTEGLCVSWGTTVVL